MSATCLQKSSREQRFRKRSRFGCRNCKLRKTKCDESKPGCRQCVSFGVMCNFAHGIPDLQAANAEVARPSGAHGQLAPQKPLAGAVWSSDESSSFYLNAKCQNLIMCYLERNLITPDDPSMREVNRGLLRLAFHVPHLMHASLAVALTYDRYLNGRAGVRRNPEEYYHLCKATTLFNAQLRKPIQDKDKDPIWGTAAALALLTCSMPDAQTPEESWPIQSNYGSGVDWLRMSQGKESLCAAVNPLRPDSLFVAMAAAFAHMHTPLPEMGIAGIPRPLVALCQLEQSSSAKSSPYFLAAHAISHTLSLPDREITNGHMQLFMRSIDGSFGELLQSKDPVALVLLYVWYNKARRCIWWIELRARVECPAILTYLQLRNKDDNSVRAVLSEIDA